MLYEYSLSNYNDIKNIYYVVEVPELYDGIYGNNFIFEIFEKTTIRVYIIDILLDEKIIYPIHRHICDKNMNVIKKIGSNIYYVPLFNGDSLNYLEKSDTPYVISIEVEINTDIDLKKITISCDNKIPYIKKKFIVNQLITQVNILGDDNT